MTNDPTPRLVVTLSPAEVIALEERLRAAAPDCSRDPGDENDCPLTPPALS